ncbi:CGLD27 family protein [Gloeocapsa sp. PCC 73106]|uniref:CGLD27 family protein n=1 Tax=Gloeocapsa sp. PCC 73106 TaxID=102232 RepID=UPI0002AC5F9C|nr:CGLD27 family protein [Gloeocapsa sp. PCC 73106]ELR96473.1 Protein of unknown function (DUF1230) [Gloeocapsa sp. PCC 73106]
MKESSSKICPVPKEQLPVNEYEQIKNAWFFSWGTLSLTSYLKKLAWIWAMGWLIAGPITAASFPPGKKPLLFSVIGGAGAGIFILLAVIQMYLGWAYVSNRLKQEMIFYEESGWYDGQIWEKPTEVVTRDRLIASYQVEPILKRLQQTALLLLLLMGISILTWFYLK